MLFLSHAFLTIIVTQNFLTTFEEIIDPDVSLFYISSFVLDWFHEWISVNSRSSYLSYSSSVGKSLIFNLVTWNSPVLTQSRWVATHCWSSFILWGYYGTRLFFTAARRNSFLIIWNWIIVLQKSLSGRYRISILIDLVCSLWKKSFLRHHLNFLIAFLIVCPHCRQHSSFMGPTVDTFNSVKTTITNLRSQGHRSTCFFVPLRSLDLPIIIHGLKWLKTKRCCNLFELLLHSWWNAAINIKISIKSVG